MIWAHIIAPWCFFNFPQISQYVNTLFPSMESNNSDKPKMSQILLPQNDYKAIRPETVSLTLTHLFSSLSIGLLGYTCAVLTESQSMPGKGQISISLQMHAKSSFCIQLRISGQKYTGQKNLLISIEKGYLRALQRCSV